MLLFEVGSIGQRPLDDTARMELAQVLKMSENDYVGVASGLLDQFSVLFGRANHALMLDCRSGDYERLPLGEPAPAIVVCDSKTSRQLADGMYNKRREECERVVAYFQPIRGDRAVTQLRDITVEDLHREWKQLDPVGRLRARHVLTENDRVRRGAEALKAGDVRTFGKLMSASHASSRDDFQNSSVAPRCPRRIGRGPARLPRRQALGSGLGRLHGQPRRARQDGRLCRGRASRICSPHGDRASRPHLPRGRWSLGIKDRPRVKE